MFKLNEAYLVKLENENKELSYMLYTESGLIGVSNKEGLIEIDKKYIEDKNKELEAYGPEYLIQANTLNPELLEEQSKNPIKMSELEERLGKDGKIDKEEQINNDEVQEQQEEKSEDDEKNTDISKMEDDISCDITSCYKIQDADFSKDVLGYQTGHENKYIAYSKSRNTFILIGESNGKFEEIQDICGAQGGHASSKQRAEYDENGNEIEVDEPSFVMMRRDGEGAALAIDMKYGGICLNKLTPSEEKPGKYVSEEMNIGHSVKPTLDELEAVKEREEQIKKAIAEKENDGDDENDGARGEKIKKVENELKEIRENDDDDYDWSTGRPIPKH